MLFKHVCLNTLLICVNMTKYLVHHELNLVDKKQVQTI